MKIMMNFLLVILSVIATENIFTYIVVLFSRYVFIYLLIYLFVYLFIYLHTALYLFLWFV